VPDGATVIPGTLIPGTQCCLFLIRDGEPQFPDVDYRNWFQFLGASGIGRLNTNTISFDVGIQRPLDALVSQVTAYRRIELS
jgi:hypothetical protein